MKEFVELRQLVAMVIRRWPILLVGVVLGAVMAHVLSQRAAPVYQATAVLVVGQSVPSAELDSRDIQIAEQLAPTYAEIARRQPVLQATVEALGLDMSWQQLREMVRVSLIDGTQLLEVTVDAGGPGEARQIADELARQLVLLGAPGVDAGADDYNVFLQERLDSLRVRIEDGQSRLAGLEAAMRRAVTVPEIRNVQEQIDVLQGLITGWESNYAQLLSLMESQKTASFLNIIGEAQASPDSIRPRAGLNRLLGATLGFILALGVVLFLGYLDDRIHTTDDLTHALGLAPLGAVHRMPGQGYHKKLISSMAWYLPSVEAFNVIRSNIRFASQDERPGVLLITSALVGEGKSLTAANLGVAMSRLGLKTVVVDTDLRRPTQHQIFGLPNKGGVGNIVEPKPNGGDVEDHLEPIDSNLYLLSSGTYKDNPAELISSPAMHGLIAGLAAAFEVVILDAPPVLTAADAAVLSHMANGVVLVVESGRTGRRAARQAVAALQHAGATILGAVLNQAPVRSSSYNYAQYTRTEVRTSALTAARQTFNLAKARLIPEPKSTSNGHREEEPVDGLPLQQD